MSLRNLAVKIAPAVATSARSIHTSPSVRGGHNTRGVFGSNLPFPVHNRYVLLVLFMGFFSSGLALPFVSLRGMIKARNP